MKLLVTGGAGFIGSAFIRSTLREHTEDEVVNLDALTYAGNLENVAEVDGDARYRFVRGDVTDRSLVFELVREVDAVVHFAAESHVDRSIHDATPFIKTNVEGTQTLLDAAVAAGNKRFHHVSTDEVFGSLALDDKPFDENTPYAPRSPYAASKAASDHLVRAAYITHGVPVTISNASNNYGPFHFPEKLIPLSILHAFEGRPIPIYGDGGQKRDWLYVEDHVRGIDLVLRQGKIGETYLLGADEDITNLELVRRLLVVMDAPEDLVTFVEDRPGHDRRYATNSAKARRELGWMCEETLESGLEKTVAWFRQNAEWVSHIKTGAYRDYLKAHYGASFAHV